MTTAVTFEDSGLGEWTEDQVFEVTAERIAEYAAATNDPIEAHLKGELASPVFAVVPTFFSLAPAALGVAPVELLMKLVHGEQDFHFHRPIRPGDVLTCRARATGYAALSTGSTVTVYAETRDADGELVNEQWLSAFFRGVDAGSTIGEQAPGHGLAGSVTAAEPVAVVTQHVDDDQTFRYSPASGDPMPIHLDEEIAQLSGLPGIINHGLCTMAFTSWAALEEFAAGDVSRLKRLAVRFARPVLPGQDITTSFWRLDDPTVDAGTTAYGFQTAVGDDLVIRDGLAVLTD
ncbi:MULTISPECIES: MaoC/PaaZ C-terminal domain-containing protein [unclassified Nocardioides]|uniref:MaoC/PaaZ C-terminal domain-containing protein n=1 Tax=unclassified Nocardioides TaxID=2615069 RepID=UPI0006F47CF8|nr:MULTISPECIES: MaoC/PaaZ C-terminal domain-containing protein [unclassified Nocardioides]KRA38802.1 dehydratase [Nocardioides sp. Root614]KRA92762.1 dehydratase [Nocardioides sp. Root682]